MAAAGFAAVALAGLARAAYECAAATAAVVAALVPEARTEAPVGGDAVDEDGLEIAGVGPQ
jgi:hypothetical protein